MTQTEKLIRDLKSRVNPATGEGWEYADIGALLGVTKQAAQQHIHDKRHQCPKCLRRLKRAMKFSKP